MYMKKGELEEIRLGVMEEVRKSLLSMNERWVTAKTLSEHVEGLKEDWIARNGSVFNRTRLEYTDKEGVRHKGSWMYPLHEIKQMVIDGRIKELVLS